ncbi:MAG: MarR family transcriptional regulator [Gammaproteobacteria bacterium]|nr:MarR family transcriptional regulator [Gammaproteobacteria bacterium]
MNAQRRRSGSGDGHRPTIGPPMAQGVDLESHLPYRLARLTNLIRQSTSDEYLKHTGMSGREWRVLGMIGLRGPLSAAETAELTGMDRATITRSVDRLETQGYVQRESDARDRRRLVLQVTPRGRRKCDQIIPLMREDGAEYDALLSAREKKLLFDIIDRLEARAHDRHNEHAARRRRRRESAD